jgi:hypothetical protein
MAEGYFGRLLRSGDAAQRFQAVLDQHFPGEAEIEEILKQTDDWPVCAGRFRGQQAVFKQIAPANVDKARAELTFLNTHLGQGPYRVARYLADVQDAGILITERVPGERVSITLKSGAETDRDRALRQCSGWLRTVSALRSTTGGFAFRAFFATLEDLDQSALSSADRDLVNSVLSALKHYRPQVRGIPITRSVCHGDFAPVNLHADEHTVWAYDIQGGPRMPLARAVARFLVAKDVFRPPVNALLLGLDAQDLKTYDSASILPKAEAERIFPLFVAEQLLRRFLGEYHTRKQLDHPRVRLAALAADLEARA